MIINKIQSLKDATKYLIGKDAEFADLFGGMKIKDNVSDLESDESLKKQGNLVYIKETSKYYTYNKDNEWQELTTSSSDIYTGETEPDNDNALWIDTTGETADTPETLNVITELQNDVNEINSQLKTLNKLVTTGIVPGDVTDSYRRQIMNEMGEPIKPDNAPDIEAVTVYTESSTTKPLEPDKTIAEPTVFHNAIKKDTSENFANNRNDLIDGEMLFYTDKKKFAVYYKGKFYVSGSGDSGSTGAGITADELQDIDLDHLTFVNNNKKYKLSINSDKKLSLTEISDVKQNVWLDEEGKFYIYVSHYLGINSLYMGGGGKSPLCSHNFVELANASNEDISLNNIYLLYTDGTPIDAQGNEISKDKDGNYSATHSGLKWNYLPLSGVIKAGSTFLIRGKECKYSVNNNTGLVKNNINDILKRSIIKVNNYDMEWYQTSENGGSELIEFKQGTSSFFLCAGTNWATTETKDLEDKTKLKVRNDLKNIWVDTSKTNGGKPDFVGYIDLAGFPYTDNKNILIEKEGSKASYVYNINFDNCIFVKWFSLESAKQGNKAYASRDTNNLWTYIDLLKNTELTNIISDDMKPSPDINEIILPPIKQYYYSQELKLKATPHYSGDDKNFFTNKTQFSKDKPNYVICSLGVQGTDNSANVINGKKATRCFNWISVGYYDEYVEIRKEGETDWKRYHSISENDNVLSDYTENKENILMYIYYYKRIQWMTSDGTYVTTHKSIVRGLDKGIYEYRIGRENDANYHSEILNFTVNSNDEVSSFSFVQTTDQQGFNWIEYQAWAKTADAIYLHEIKNNTDPIKFIVNTGDITQNGNRVNEWMDYYNGRNSLKNVEEMFSVGNNDLCGYDATELTDGADATSKYNDINMLRYYNFEIDDYPDFTPQSANQKHPLEFNVPQWSDSIYYPLRSTYSFNYGKWHFISVNSEIAFVSSKIYHPEDEKGVGHYANCANKAIEDWLITDISKWIKEHNFDITSTKYIIIYMHEMPFTIVTNDFQASDKKNRDGCHINIYNGNNTDRKYRLSRLFQKLGIRLVFGGHKHTYSISKPIYDAPSDYISNNTVADNYKNENIFNITTNENGVIQDVKINPDIAFLTNVVTEQAAHQPVIQVTNLSYAPAKDDYGRYEVVNKINAPIYVMSQASGYKLVSNKELPADKDHNISWLMNYFASTSGQTGNANQFKPMYIRYDLTDTEIKVTAKRVTGIWDGGIGVNTKKYDINKQPTNNTVQSVTLLGVNENQLQYYSQPTSCSFIITL